MRYIGRIITNTKIDDVSEFIEVTEDSSSIFENETKIPTLIVGYKRAQEICGDVKFFKRKIGKNLYWTFSKRERRVDYDQDILTFQKTVSDFLLKCCQYEYVDMMTCDDQRRNIIVGLFVDTRNHKVVYETATMYYIYVPCLGKVYGVSKEILKNSTVPGLVDGHRDNPSVVFITGDESSYPNLSKSKFVIPLLYYLKTF